MIRWSLLLFSLGSFSLMFLAPSPGWFALGLFGFLFGSIATTLAFAHVRIASRARREDVAVHGALRQRSRPDSTDRSDDPLHR